MSAIAGSGDLAERTARLIGFNIATLFFAPASLLCFPLFYESGELPRMLGGLGGVGSTLMIAAPVATLVEAPGLRVITLAAWVPVGSAEVTTAFSCSPRYPRRTVSRRWL